MAFLKNNHQERPVRKTTHWKQLFSSEMIALSWAPIVLFCTCHYFTGSEEHWLHDIYRRLYYFPIVFAALHRGLWGGVVVALVVSLSYAPHAFFHYFEHDPETSLEKVLEIIFYNALGYLCGFLADRQETKRVEAKVAKKAERGAQKQLERAQRLAIVGELVAGIAHEIKNPLHTIQGATEIVDKIVPKERPESEMWTVIKNELKRLSRIAERFLSYAKPSAPELRELEIREILSSTEELLSAQARQNDVKLVVEKSSNNQNLLVKVDKDQIIQVLIDIAVNGFHAMENTEHRELLIYSNSGKSNNQNFAIIALQNSGPLIPEEDLERVFNPFYTTRANGTGLGLSTAMKIVEQHEGYIYAKNTGTAEGVVFEVHLPIVNR